MKIKILKNGTFNAKPSGFCPFQVDDSGLKGPRK
jgi:hypothetical protein